MFQIAFDRGISVNDLAHALGEKPGTVLVHTRQAGFAFGRRPQLAEPLTLEQLQALGDSAVPTPEFYGARAKAERLARVAKAKRDRRAEARKDDPFYRPLGPRKKVVREAAPAAVCRPVGPAPSREPALPAPQQARAHPITIVRTRPNAPRHVNYAERMNAAIAHLRARNFVVQRHNRDEIIARWHVSGWTGLFSNEQVIALAQHHGLELQA